MDSMGVASGCGCKEVYRFPNITYPYSSCICSFLQQHPYILFIKNFFFNIIVHRRPHACIRCDIQQARTCLCESQTT